MSHSIVVSDAGPLHYLILIDRIDILQRLFEHVLVPFAVRDELLHANAPKKVRDWLGEARPWFEVCSVLKSRPIRGLHPGESEALQLALQKKVAAVLMDDLDGRNAAKKLNIAVIGTIAILENASAMDLLDLNSTFSKLRETNFFAPPELFQAALRRDQLRKSK